MNTFICLELLDQVEMGHSHRGRPQRSQAGTRPYGAVQVLNWKGKNRRLAHLCPCLTRQLHHAFVQRDGVGSMWLHISHAGGFLGTRPHLPAQHPAGCKILWNCCGYLCLSRTLQSQWVWHLCFRNFSDNLQARILHWKQKGRAWGMNLVQLHPDNCTHTHRLGSEMQAFENTMKKVLIYISYYCEGTLLLLKVTLYLHFFKVRATWLSPGSLPELNVPSGTPSYFKVQLRHRDEGAPLSSSHSFFWGPFLCLLTPERKLICHPVQTTKKFILFPLSSFVL